jgi:hypothetical protein
VIELSSSTICVGALALGCGVTQTGIMKASECICVTFTDESFFVLFLRGMTVGETYEKKEKKYRRKKGRK